MPTLLDQTNELLFDQIKCIEGKAEIVDGGIFWQPPVGAESGLCRAQIACSLRDYTRHTKQGRALINNL
jgi:hypothetical protein